MLTYGRLDLISISYTYLDFMSDMNSIKSTSRYMFTLRVTSVNWRSIEQQCIADSIIEAKYVTTTEAAKEADWLKKFLLELGVVPQDQLLIIIYYDNNGAIAQSKTPRNHKGRKHIE